MTQPLRLSDWATGIVRDARFSATDRTDGRVSRALLFAASRRYMLAALRHHDPTAVITTPDLAEMVPNDLGLAVAQDPTSMFFSLHQRLAVQAPPVLFEPGIDPSATIHATATVGSRVRVDAGAVIGAGAIIEDGTWVGEACEIGPQAVVSCTGHYSRTLEGRFVSVRHMGGVRMAVGARVLARAAISRAVFADFTELGAETVISVGAHVGHGCCLGARVVVTGAAQICGFTNIGAGAWIGPGAVIRNLCHVGEGARVEIGAVVASAVPKDGHVSGNFAMPHVEQLHAFRQMRAAARAESSS